jgi:hypothetical protein
MMPRRLFLISPGGVVWDLISINCGVRCEVDTDDFEIEKDDILAGFGVGVGTGAEKAQI